MAGKRIEKPDYYTQREWNRIRAREKAQARATRNLVIIMLFMLVIAVTLIFGVWYFIFRSHDTGLRMPYNVESNVFGIHNGGSMMVKAVPFAAGLCVTDTDVDADAVFISAAEAALFDVTAEKVVYAKNIFEQRSPASVTKIMTALVAMRYGNIDDMVKEIGRAHV